MRKLKLVTGEYYHIYNRGVEKRSIFLDYSDHRRFLVSLEKLNQEGPVSNFRLKMENVPAPSKANAPKLVDIICYCLMPNHFHLLVRQAIPDGVSHFMHKIGTSYTNYFNKKYERDGALFQGTYRIKHIEGDDYLLHVSRYIHLNPLGLISVAETGTDWQALEKYPWSSLRYYIYDSRHYGKNVKINIENVIVMNQFQSRDQYRAFVKSPIDEQMMTNLKID